MKKEIKKIGIRLENKLLKQTEGQLQQSITRQKIYKNLCSSYPELNEKQLSDILNDVVDLDLRSRYRWMNVFLVIVLSLLAIHHLLWMLIFILYAILTVDMEMLIGASLFAFMIMGYLLWTGAAVYNISKYRGGLIYETSIYASVILPFLMSGLDISWPYLLALILFYILQAVLSFILLRKLFPKRQSLFSVIILHKLFPSLRNQGNDEL